MRFRKLKDPEKPKRKRPIVGPLILGIVIIGIIAAVSDPHPAHQGMTWHYAGPKSKEDLTKEAVDVLFHTCPRVMIYSEYLADPDVTFVSVPDSVSRYGGHAAVIFTTAFKDQPITPKPSMSMDPTLKFGSHDQVLLALIGDPVNGIAVSDRGGYFLCDIDKPPIGHGHVLKPAEQLAGLTP